MATQIELFSDDTFAEVQVLPARRRYGGKWQRESAARWIVRQTLDHQSMEPDMRENFSAASWKMHPIPTAGDATDRTPELTNMSNHHHRHSRNHGSAPEPHTPAWMRLHQDWRFWFAVVLMFACMIIYVMSEDLAWRPAVQRSPAPPAQSP